MSESLYRAIKLILLAIFVVGFLVVGSRIERNGRYVQLDHRKDWVVIGNSASGHLTEVMDTRTGYVRDAHDPANP